MLHATSPEVVIHWGSDLKVSCSNLTVDNSIFEATYSTSVLVSLQKIFGSKHKFVQLALEEDVFKIIQSHWAHAERNEKF